MIEGCKNECACSRCRNGAAWERATCIGRFTCMAAGAWDDPAVDSAWPARPLNRCYEVRGRLQPRYGRFDNMPRIRSRGRQMRRRWPQWPPLYKQSHICRAGPQQYPQVYNVTRIANLHDWHIAAKTYSYWCWLRLSRRLFYVISRHCRLSSRYWTRVLLINVSLPKLMVIWPRAVWTVAIGVFRRGPMPVRPL